MADTEKLSSLVNARSRRHRLKLLGELTPRFSLAFDVGLLSREDYFLSLPFRRSRFFSVFTFGFLVVFTIPLFTVGGTMIGQYDGELFSLVFMLFSLFWMLGWSVAVVILALVFLIVACGRETLRVRGDELILRIGIPGLGFGARYQGAVLRNFRRRGPEEASGNDWRGPHLCFDYAGETIGFGSAIDEAGAEAIITRLQELFPAHGQAPVTLPQAPPPEPEPEIRPAPIAGIEQEAPNSFASLSGMALIGANLIPLVGVLVDDWNIGEIMLLFWAESAVIGFYTLCKMWKIGGWTVFFYGPFFVGHYGAFMVGHLLFIYGLFASDFASNQDVPVSVVAEDLLRMAPALLAFFISHGISYVKNFLGRQEYRGMEIGKQMSQPYKRIVIMHVTIILGGFLVLGLGSPLGALLLLILLKMAADLRSHLAEHGSGSSRN